MATSTASPERKAGRFDGLYTGSGVFDVVGRRRTWYVVFGVLMIVCVLSMVFRGFNLGIDFTGGTQLQFPTQGTSVAVEHDAVEDVVRDAVGQEPASVQIAGTGASQTVIIRTESLDPAQLVDVRAALAETFGPPGGPAAISDSGVSGTWGGQITQQALIALAVFLVLVTLFLAFYFERAMAIGALVALVHDIVVTAGIYSLIGFEVTPGTVIGLLTILGFSLYDTVVVFDKVKENTHGIMGLTRQTYAEASNLAVNQTLIRSVNTSVIAVLPVIGLLVVGVGVLGVGTLADLALVQMVGIIAGVVSSLLLAVPVMIDVKLRDPKIRDQARKVEARRKRAAQRVTPDGSAADDDPVTEQFAAHADDDGLSAVERRREQAVAAAGGVPSRHSRGGSRAGSARPTGKRRR